MGSGAAAEDDPLLPGGGGGDPPDVESGRERGAGGSGSGSAGTGGGDAGASTSGASTSGGTAEAEPFGAADAEIERVLKEQKNYYKVLRCARTASTGTIKKQYLKLARLIHPDKCRHPKAGEAMAIVTSAHGTLSNSVTRSAYNMYADSVDTSAEGSDNFDSWSSGGGGAGYTPHVPEWLANALSNPVGGPILAVLIAFVLIILLIIVGIIVLIGLAIYMVFWVICAAGCCGHCWPYWGEGKRKNDERARKFAEAYEQASREAGFDGASAYYGTFFNFGEPDFGGAQQQPYQPPPSYYHEPPPQQSYYHGDRRGRGGHHYY